MKFAKNKNIILIALSLFLSLVSFTGVANHLPAKAIKTALVIDNYDGNTLFSIPYQRALKENYALLVSNSRYSFTAVQNNYSTKVITAFKNYKFKMLWLRTKLQLTKFHTSSIHQILYDNRA